jgi:2'-5' RNA ligase
VWEPIQAIRRQYDRQFSRWMPHINLLYPFLPLADFHTALPLLAEACTGVRPFAVTLTTVRYFLHPSHRATLWLEPEPREPFIALENRLLAAFPAYNELCRFAGGFTPHLSVGQASSPTVLQRLLQELQARWQPCQFVLTAVALIHREADRPFRLVHWIALGG